MKNQLRKALVSLLVMTMLLSTMVGCSNNTGDMASGSTGASVQPQMEELGTGAAKWTEKETSDGWVEVTNEGGITLGYSKASGVSLIQADGFAFKDLNGNGVLDVYEDWRQDANTRAQDLASKMSGEEIASLATHGGWSYFGNKISSEDLEYIKKGGRDGVTRSSSYEGSTVMAVTWTNAMQEAAEGDGNYGIPLTISVDPHNISNTIDQLGLAATMNTELAHEIGIETAKEYRAVGVTMLLGPQIDLISTPVFNRGNAAYSEDPALARDLAAAFIDGLQSTFDASGSDLGWGKDSVIAVAKHYAGAGSSEGGRNDHDWEGKYSVYPGNAFNTHLIPFFDGAFTLDGKTKSTGAIMTNYAIAYSEDGSLGEPVGGAYSEYRLNLLKEAGYDGFIMTDWGILTPSGDEEWTVNWGVENLTTAECFALLFKLGVHQVGGSTDIVEAVEGYKLLVEELGQETALEIIREAARHILIGKINVGLFENPYISTENAVANAWTESSKAFGDETQQQSVIMLKNDSNIIGSYDANAEKSTVYIPYTINVDGNVWSGYTYSCVPSVDIDVAGRYFNVVTDTVGEPTGIDEEGNKIYTIRDIMRASTQEIATCDYAIVKMTGAYTISAYDEEAERWLPPSLQYEEYTADSEFVRRESISGDLVMKEIESVYGTVKQEGKENRSYYGNTAARPRTYGSYETLKFVSGEVSSDCKVIVSMELTHGAMVWSEVEPLADVILVRYKDGALFVGNSEVGADVIMGIIVGDVEPGGLLPVQQPASMEAVEAQLEDVPRDTKCYVDANGNTYDFAFGLNWAGVIQDARTEKYNVPALTTPENMEK